MSVHHPARLTIQRTLNARKVLTETQCVDGVRHVELVEREGDQIHQVKQARGLAALAGVSGRLMQLLVWSNVEVPRTALQLQAAV